MDGLILLFTHQVQIFSRERERVRESLESLFCLIYFSNCAHDKNTDNFYTLETMLVKTEESMNNSKFCMS